MDNGFWLALGLLLLGIIILAVTHVARRIGRLNTLLIKSRRTLDYALNARANAAKDFASSGALDMAASLVLAESADECLRAGKNPLVDDGLDSVEHNDREQHTEPSPQRTACESALSRILRITVDELNITDTPEKNRANSSAEVCGNETKTQGSTLHSGDTHTHLALTDEQMRLFSQVERARFDVRMARSFHNSHVDQVRRLRRSSLVRIFHLAGRAPVPQTIDIDDE